MNIARHVGKRRRHLWMQGVSHVENKRPPREVVVREQQTPFRHNVFGVMYLHAHLVGDGGRSPFPARVKLHDLMFPKFKRSRS